LKDSYNAYTQIGLIIMAPQPVLSFPRSSVPDSVNSLCFLQSQGTTSYTFNY